MPAATRFWGAAPAPPVDAPAEGQGLLGFFQSGLSGYVPLRSGERTNEEEAYLSLSHWERFLGFLCCLAGSALCFLFSFFFLAPPILALRPHKFALAFTLGNVLFLVGAERWPFSTAYLSSMVGTLYFALGPRWRLVTLLCAVMEMAALLAYVAAYFPGGTTTLRYAASMLARGGSSLLPL